MQALQSSSNILKTPGFSGAGIENTAGFGFVKMEIDFHCVCNMNKVTPEISATLKKLHFSCFLKLMKKMESD